AMIRKQIEDEVASGLAKLGPMTDKLKREEARTRLLDGAFAAAATKNSDCPSKERGGDLGWFPWGGGEAFAAAAFALQPFQMSEIVTTPFGHHLILVLEVKPGQNVKFADSKEVVRDVFSDRLRSEMLTRLRPAAKIEINPASKP